MNDDPATPTRLGAPSEKVCSLVVGRQDGGTSHPSVGGSGTAPALVTARKYSSPVETRPAVPPSH